MTTIFPRVSSSWTRNGRTSMIRASTWRSVVMIPDWLPVKLIASPPSSRMAIDRSAIEMGSPAVRSMSSSRRSGLAETCLASPSRSSVVSPIAETTTTTSCPALLVRMTRSATCRMRETSATLEPPYFWTTTDMAVICHESTKTRKQDASGSFSWFRVFVAMQDSLRVKRRNYRRVIARPDLFLNHAGARARGERRADERVVEPPPDVALTHVAPRRPPGEQTVVVRLEHAAQIDEAARENPLDDRPLFRQLSDRARLPFLGMDVHVGPRDVHVAAHDQVPAGGEGRRVVVHRLQEPHLGRKVLAAVRHVDRGHGRVAELDDHDPVLVVEGRMDERRLVGRDRLADVQADARVALFAAVPVAPVALHFA